MDIRFDDFDEFGEWLFDYVGCGHIRFAVHPIVVGEEGRSTFGPCVLDVFAATYDGASVVETGAERYLSFPCDGNGRHVVIGENAVVYADVHDEEKSQVVAYMDGGVAIAIRLEDPFPEFD